MDRHLLIATYLKSIREFFWQQNFMDVITPPIVENPGMEVHIHPFGLYDPYQKKIVPKYLHTSPEFHMKELLSRGHKKIFTMGYCFRNELGQSPIHRDQFLMLEWYRAYEHYNQLKSDLVGLINFLIEKAPNSINKKVEIKRVTVDELFIKHLGFKVSDYLTTDTLYEKLLEKKAEISIPKKESLSYDDCFFLLFFNFIEPEIKKLPYVIIDEYPAPLAALSTIKKANPAVCERFELYIDGVEIANAFNELTNLKEQKIRFERQAEEKLSTYQYQLPPANILFEALERGMPPACGIALGVERLIFALNQQNTEVFWD